MGTRAIGSQMSVVDSRMERNRSRRTHILIRVLKDERLQLGSKPLALVENALVVDGSSSALDSDVRAEVEIELERMSTARFDKRTWKRIAVAVAFAVLREEADVVTLASNDDGELGDRLAAQLLEALLHVAHFLLKNSRVLALANAVTDVQDAMRGLALADALHPILGHEAEVLVDIGGSDHLNTVAVGLNLSPVLGVVRVGRDSDGRKGCSFTRAGSRGWVRHVGANNHSRDADRLGRSLGDDIGLCNRSTTTELGVDLHADIGDVLWRGRHDVLGLEDLRSNAKAEVAGLLDTAVNLNVAVVDDEEQEARRTIEPDVR
jgi:hypothetical protein